MVGIAGCHWPINWLLAFSCYKLSALYRLWKSTVGSVATPRNSPTVMVWAWHLWLMQNLQSPWLAELPEYRYCIQKSVAVETMRSTRAATPQSVPPPAKVYSIVLKPPEHSATVQRRGDRVEDHVDVILSDSLINALNGCVSICWVTLST